LIYAPTTISESESATSAGIVPISPPEITKASGRTALPSKVPLT